MVLQSLSRSSLPINHLATIKQGRSSLLLSLQSYQSTASEILKNNLKEEVQSSPVNHSEDRPTWTYAQQQFLVSHELSKRRAAMQLDDNAFRRVKAELKRSGTVTGVGALQLLDQQVIDSLSERRREQRRHMNMKKTKTRSASF